MLVVENNVFINGKKARNSDIYNYIRQKPNKKALFFFRFGTGLYNMANPDTSASAKNIHGFLKRIGEKPVVLLDKQTEKSTTQMELFYKKSGYFYAEAKSEVKNKRKNKKKAVVNYYINTGPQYFLRNISYENIEDPQLKSMAKLTELNNFVESGMPYDLDILDKERDRLTALYKNNGYYKFSKEYIHFLADSTLNNHEVDLSVKIKNPKVKIDSTVVDLNHYKYQFRNIYIQTDYDPENILAKTDTTYYDGYHIITTGETKFKPEIVINQLRFRTGQLYSKEIVEQSYRNISTLRAFKGIRISFSEPEIIEDDLKMLDCNIKLSPFSKLQYSLDQEFTHTSGNLGLAGSVTFTNKNLFKGAENLDVRFTGSIESQQTTEDNPDAIFNVWELSSEVTLKIPKFVSPINMDKYLPINHNARTNISVSLARQNRPDFNRSTVNTAFGYTWQEGKNKQHAINPIELSFISIETVSDTIFKGLNGTILEQQFKPHLITATSYSYTFNNQNIDRIKNHSYFKGHIELSGNILRALGEIGVIPQEVDSTSSNNRSYQILNNKFTQYAKVFFDLRHFIELDEDHTLGFRSFTGAAIPYGNSDAVPFQKQFFVGGSNDLRAYEAYSLGPGSFEGDTTNYYTADLKIAFNIEYRFPIINSLKGALFTDIGNVWTLEKIINDKGVEVREGSEFQFDRFYKEFGVGAGFGIRYDFSFFVIRFDVGIPLTNPRLPSGKRWIGNDIELRTTRFNFGLGYPF
mgnify:CR=1 FL=1